MSMLKYYKQLSTMCRIPCCKWYGHYKELEHHFNIIHPDNKITIDLSSTFEICVNKLRQHEKYLISNNENVYWFSYNEGLFAIGESQDVKYYVSAASNEFNEIDICGPFSTAAQISTYFRKEIVKDEENLVIYFEKDTTEENGDSFELYEANQPADDLDEMARKFTKNCTCDPFQIYDSNPGEPDEDLDEIARKFLVNCNCDEAEDELNNIADNISEDESNYESTNDEAYSSYAPSSYSSSGDTSDATDEGINNADSDDEPEYIFLYEEYEIDFCDGCYEVIVDGVPHPNALDIENGNFSCLFNNLHI